MINFTEGWLDEKFVPPGAHNEAKKQKPKRPKKPRTKQPMCAYCRKRRRVYLRKGCRTCIEWRKKPKTAEEQLEWKCEWYKKRLKQGLCQTCGKNPHRRGKMSCADCAKKQHKYHIDRKAARAV